MREGTDIESAVLDLFVDDDGDIDVAEALTSLLVVVGGLCCQATSQSPMDLATEFSIKLRRAVSREQISQRMLS